MKLIFTLLFLLSLSYLGGAQTNDIYIEGTSVFTEGIICAGGDFTERSGKLYLNGELCFKNSQEIKVDLVPESDYSSSIFNFKGTGDAILIANGAMLNELEVNLSRADLKLEDELHIKDRLTLFNGRVIAENDNFLYLKNTSERAIVYNNSEGNSSYVIGDLKRDVLSNAIYHFPLGDREGFHPIYLSGLDVKTSVKVGYDSDADQKWFVKNADSKFAFPTSGAWLVETENNSSYRASLSLFDKTGSALQGKYAVLFTDDYPFFNKTPFVDREAETSGQFLLDGSRAYVNGMLAVVESPLGLISSQGQIELVNTIIINGSANEKTRFLVHGKSDFKKINLMVYNSLGGLVFSSKNYQDDLDFRNYRDGTYYYHMSAVLTDGSVVKKSDIIEVVRTNE